MRSNLSFLTVPRVDRFYRVTDIGVCAEHAYKRENLGAYALGSVHLTHKVCEATSSHAFKSYCNAAKYRGTKKGGSLASVVTGKFPRKRKYEFMTQVGVTERNTAGIR